MQVAVTTPQVVRSYVWATLLPLLVPVKEGACVSELLAGNGAWTGNAPRAKSVEAIAPIVSSYENAGRAGP